MQTVLRFTESALLLAMGVFMAALSQSSLYWQFINPKYSWLTLLTGLVLTAIGIACTFNKHRQRHISESLGIIIFLAVAATAIASSQLQIPDDEPNYRGSLGTEYIDEDTSPTVAYEGSEYQKINVVELLQEETLDKLTFGQKFAFQGAVVRTPELDKAGYIGVGRLLITCCFADSTGVVTLVKVDDPQLFPKGIWVRTLGILEQGTPFPGDTITVKGALTAVRSEHSIIRGITVEESRVDGTPFVFEVRTQAPYAY
jgi:uncharacterized repeat protein (TIGR03943 family)